MFQITRNQEKLPQGAALLPSPSPNKDLFTTWFPSRNLEVKASLLLFWAVQAQARLFIVPLKSTIQIFSPLSLFLQAVWQENRQTHRRIPELCLQAKKDLWPSIKIPEWLSNRVNKVQARSFDSHRPRTSFFMHLWYFYKPFLYTKWSALRNFPGLCMLPGEGCCASDCSHTLDKSQDTAEKYAAWQEWLFIHFRTASQEVLVYVNVLGKK